MSSLYDARTKMLGYFARPDHYDGFTRRLLGTYQSRVVADVATAGLDDTKRMLDVGTQVGCRWQSPTPCPAYPSTDSTFPQA
jgi:hypothetical protein